MCLKLVCFVIALQFATGNGSAISSGDSQNQFYYKISNTKHSGIPKYLNEMSYRTERQVLVNAPADVINDFSSKLSSRIHSLSRKKRQFDNGGWNWGDSSNESPFGFPGNGLGSTQNPLGSVEIPGMGTRRPPCEDNCQGTPQYNPVCGSDDITYFSMWRFRCAQNCGKRIAVKHLGACSKIPPRG